MKATGHRLGLIAGAAVVFALSAWRAALAQDTVPSSYSGRDFGGLVFELPAQQGGVLLSASKAWTWNEEGAPLPGIGGAGRTIGGVVNRMYLTGDVKIKLGPRRFDAARAVVWVERLGDEGGKPVQQVAVYFDRVGNPLAGSGTGLAGDRLLATARVVGEVTLACDTLPTSEPPPAARGQNFFLDEAHQRLARYLDVLEAKAEGRPPAPAPAAAPTPTRDNVPFTKYVPGVSQVYEPGSPLGPDGPRVPASVLNRVARGASPFEGTFGDERLFSSRGAISVAAGQIAVNQGAAGSNESTLTVTGGVVLMYSEPTQGRSLQLTAQNAVLFLKGEKLDELTRFNADNVLGVYLEGDVVATDGRFTLRAPHVYYDVVANEAYTIDAVFWTYDQQRGLPLYIRAASVRQGSRKTIEATGVKLAASSFFDPMLALGASSVTLSREPRKDGGERIVVNGKGLQPRFAGVPLGYFPSYKGDLDRFALKDIRFENSSGSGFGVQTRWDFHGLTGIAPPPDLRFDLLLDGWLKRGPAVGVDLAWDTPQDKGAIFGYIVPTDSGTDILTSGHKVDRSSDTRGMLTLEQQLLLDGGWKLTLEGSYISDENFVDSYYETLAETRREFANAISLTHTNENAQFDLTVKGTFNDFTANEYLLQSQGFTVSRTPEARYTRIADDVTAGRGPGRLHYTSEYRVGRVGFDFEEPTAAQLGYPSAAAAAAAFGFAPTDSWARVLRLRGLSGQSITRADTRHELDWNLDWGPVRFTPFVVGRATYYSDEFTLLSAPGSNDQLRWWAAAGARASTQLQRIYENAESAILDIHKVRHIVEPSVAVWSAGTNRRSETLPIYDDEVEGISEGTALRIGLSQTFQTQRGTATSQTGRVVDFLRWNIDYVQSTDDTNRQSPLGRWYDARPEESLLGEFASTDVSLLLTDATTATFTQIFDFDRNQPARTTAGLAIEHSADFKTFAEMRFLNPRDVTYVDLGADYRLTPLYTLSSTATFDADKGEFQTVAVRINREFPDLTVSFKIRYNNITSETTTGLVVTPLGRNRRLEDLRRIGRDRYLEPGDAPASLPRDVVP